MGLGQKPLIRRMRTYLFRAKQNLGRTIEKYRLTKFHREIEGIFHLEKRREQLLRKKRNNEILDLLS